MITEKMLGQGNWANTTNNLVYTATAVTTGVTAVQLCNVTASPVTIQLYYVPVSGSPTISNAVLYDFNIPANDYHSFSPEKPHYLDVGDMIYFQNGTASGVTITVSGVEIS